MRLFSLIALVAFVGCSSPQSSRLDQWMEPNGKVKVLSTVGMIDDLVGKVGGDAVDHITLIDGALDPHSYELVKGDSEKLVCADIIFANGLGLEHGPSLHRYLAGNEKAVALGDAIVIEDPEALVRVEGAVDPHIWMDVSLWSRGVDVIVQTLSEKVPERAAEFRARGERLRRRLTDLDTEVMVTMDTVPLNRRYLVTGHDAFNYFTRRYLATRDERIGGTWEERSTAPEGLAPEGQLSSADIQNVINHLSVYKVEVIFPESNLSRDAIRKIQNAGGKKGLSVRIAEEPLYGDALGEPGTDGSSYEGMIRHNARVIAKHLGQS